MAEMPLMTPSGPMSLSAGGKRLEKWIVELVGSGPFAGRGTVVWIDIAAFNEHWRRTVNSYIPSGAGNREEYARFGVWLATKVGLKMPYLDVVCDHVEFTNGQHRFASMRHHGVEALPIAASRDDAEVIRGTFPTDIRDSLMRR
jgi:hypothetical protein